MKYQNVMLPVAKSINSIFFMMHIYFLYVFFFFFKLAGNKRTQTILKLDFSPLLLQKRIEVFSGVLK